MPHFPSHFPWSFILSLAVLTYALLTRKKREEEYLAELRKHPGTPSGWRKL